MIAFQKFLLYLRRKNDIYFKKQRKNMSDQKKIKTALVSVFHKDGLDEIIKLLHAQGVTLLSTGGTQKFIEGLGVPCNAVEDLTTYPSILGGRVKTLHPKVFGGILGRRDNEGDKEQMAKYAIPEIDLVIVDLYTFEDTVAAKNFKDVIIVASKAQYQQLADILKTKGAVSDYEDRLSFAEQAFGVSSHYDTAIHAWFAQQK